jgi:succinoglycan biosynthesis transport protein ExoP
MMRGSGGNIMLQNNPQETEFIEIRHYLYLIRRWIWLIVLGTIFSAGAAFLVSRGMPPVYQAKTTVMVSNALTSQSADYNSVVTSQQLAITYSQMMTSREVLEGVIAQLNLKMTPEQLKNSLSATPIQDTQLISVVDEDTDPERAAKIANTAVLVFTSTIQSNISATSTTFAAGLQAQIQQVEQKISSLQEEMQQQSTLSHDDTMKGIEDIITQLQSNISQTKSEMVRLEYDFPLVSGVDATGKMGMVTATPSLDQRIALAAKQDELDAMKAMLDKYQTQYVALAVAGQYNSTMSSAFDQLNSVISLYQGIYTNLMQNYEELRLSNIHAAGTIIQVDTAAVPLSPVRPKVWLYAMIGGFLGFVACTGGVLLLDVLDDSITNPEVISRRYNLQILGTIFNIPGKDKALTVRTHPRSAVAEAFRILRTNILHATGERPFHTLLVTSPTPSAGKTTLTTNLAAVMSQGGLRVTLIDADMRRPQLHEAVNAKNEIGLSNLLGQPTPRSLEEVVQSVNGFSLISAGSPIDNPSDLLQNEPMHDLLDKLSQDNDMIIIDSPPVLSVTDSLVLSSYVDGILLIIMPSATSYATLEQSLQQLHRVDANLIGVVLNETEANPEGPYYSQYYAYGANDDSSSQVTGEGHTSRLSLRNLDRFAGKTLRRFKAIFSRREQE